MFKRLGEREGWSSVRRGGGLCTLQALSGEGWGEETVLPRGMSSVTGLWSCSTTVWLLPWETRSKDHMEHCLEVVCMCSHHRERRINPSNSLIPTFLVTQVPEPSSMHTEPTLGDASAEFGWGQITWTASLYPSTEGKQTSFQGQNYRLNPTWDSFFILIGNSFIYSF